jgi:hypothetical protein
MPGQLLLRSSRRAPPSASRRMRRRNGSQMRGRLVAVESRMRHGVARGGRSGGRDGGESIMLGLRTVWLRTICYGHAWRIDVSPGLNPWTHHDLSA